MSFDIWGSLTGSSKDAGALGVGQYKAAPVAVDRKDYEPNDAITQQRAALAQALRGVDGRTAPQMQAAGLGSAYTTDAARVNTVPQNQFRSQQTDLAAALTQQANGNGPSLAQNQLQNATDRNLKQALALQATQRGTNAGAGARQLAQGAAAMNGEAARQSADLRMQEQMSARQQLAGVLGNARQQDIGLANDQAGYDQQAGLANMGARNQFAMQQGQFNQQAAMTNQQSAMAQGDRNDTQSRFLMGQMGDMAQRDRDAVGQYNALRVGQNTGLAGVNQRGYEAAGKARGSAISGLGQAMGMGGGGLGSAMGMGGAGSGASGAGAGGEGKFDSGGGSDGNYVDQNQSPYSGGNAPDVASQPSSPDSSINYTPSAAQNAPGTGNYLYGGRPSTYRYAHGGQVPGKAPVKGDSPENDIVHTALSPGEIVLPRTIVGDDKRILAFVKALREKQQAGESHEAKLAKVLGKKKRSA